MSRIEIRDTPPKEWFGRHGCTVKTDAEGNTVSVTASPESTAEMVETDRGGREIRAYSHPLDFLRKLNDANARKGITLRQFDAGERLMEHYLAGVERSRYVTMRFGRMAGDFDPDRAEHHARCYRLAMQAVQGVKQRMAVYDCCCVGEFVHRRGRYLKEGLDDLARHFRIR